MNISVQLKNCKHILNIKVTLMQSIQDVETEIPRIDSPCNNIAVALEFLITINILSKKWNAQI